MSLTGQNVHQAYANAFPSGAFSWDDISEEARATYEKVAEELNRELDAQRAWFEGGVTITAVRCPHCKEMLDVAHAEGHACWVSNDSQLDTTLGEYCRSLQAQSEEMLKGLVEDYGLESRGQNKHSYINALVEDYRRQLKGDV